MVLATVRYAKDLDVDRPRTLPNRLEDLHDAHRSLGEVLRLRGDLHQAASAFRTAAAAKDEGQGKALRVAFFGGAVMGLSVAALGLLGLGVAAAPAGKFIRL